MGHTKAASDGKRAVSASEDNTLIVWDLESGKAITKFIGDSSLMSCAITPDGATIIVGEWAGWVHFLRLEGMCSSHM